MSWESIHCGGHGGKKIRSVHDGSNKVAFPKWCPLKDMREQGVKVGVSVFIFNKFNEILIGHRIPDDLWGLPGGGMIAGETPKRTAIRETFEETSLNIAEEWLEFATFTNDIFLEEKNEHWITLYFISRQYLGVPNIVEPDKCSVWQWCSLDKLPSNLFCEWGKFIPELKSMVTKTSL